MPFFVAVHHTVHPGQRVHRIQAVRNDFAASTKSFPARRFARLFEHLHDRTRLLAFEEWHSKPEFEQHQSAPTYVQEIAESGPEPRHAALERLQHYRHLPHSPAALACTAISSPPERASEVERFICDDERRDALVAAGLALRAVYRTVGGESQLLVLHGWRTLELLEQYLADAAPAMAASLATYGATLDQFAGQIAAEYSWLES
jgi:quinol monooxygenase YgiN